ncbi:carbamoyltransferase N-terminal domain-containing protein [Thalassobaculum sp.]
MLIVGIQCGHDASVVVLQDGRILVHLERERVSRIRHDESMSAELIHQALRYCGLDAGDVDMFAVSTTQRYGYQSDDASRLSFAYDWASAEKIGAARFRRTVFDRAAHLAETTRVRAIHADGH